MKKIVLIFSVMVFLLSCQSSTEKKEEAAAPATPATTTEAKPAIEMPFTASYSSNFTQDVSDADLKTVMDSYVYWRDNKIDELTGIMGDTTWVDMPDGTGKRYPNAELKKMWKAHRDSMTSVDLKFDAWTKMKSDKGDNLILTWYKEIDKYKTGVIDSAYYHDINIIKDGKIVWYSTYKKPAK